MAKTLRLAVLSDTHITTQADAVDGFCWNRVLSTRSLAQLPQLVQALTRLQPDLILHLGDLTNDGSLSAYRAALAQLEQVGVPVRLVPGNHDSGPVRKHLIEETGGTDWSFVLGPIRFILLDSTVRESRLDPVAGDPRKRIIRPQQLRWLQSILQADPQPLTVLATHFPLLTRPFYQASLDPDQRRVQGLTAEEIGRRIGYLGNSQALQDLLARHPSVRLCLSGHWHMRDIIQTPSLTQVIAPSTCEYPCAFYLLEFEGDRLTLESHPSGIDPEASFVPSRNAFSAGWSGFESRVLSLG